MNKGLRNELLTLCGIGALGSLLLRRPKATLAFGLAAAGATALARKSGDYSFRRKSVVITGGSRGLGLAIAKELAKEGALLTLLARDADELKRAREIILSRVPGANVHVIACDITKSDQLTRAFEQSLGVWGSVDVLINNAGAILVGPFESLTREDFEAQMELHLYAVIRAVQWALPHFRRRRKGRIVNICSMGGRVAVPHMLPYDTSKFALAGFSQGLTAELALEGIPVTTVYPTLMRTGSPIQAVFKGDHEKEYAWFAAGDNLPGLSMSAIVAARKIIEATRHGKRELIPTALGQVRLGMGIFFPELMAWSMGFLNRLLPRGKSKDYHTGAESRGTLDNSLWSQFLKERAQRLESALNQVPKEDAKYNIGLLH